MTETLLLGKRGKMRLNRHDVKVIYPGKPLSYEEGSKKIRRLLKQLTQ